MLTALSIRDVVLIERLDLAFGPGLTVLTGETGAGKSILFDSLGLALGARADAGLVRAEAAQAAVSAVFSPRGNHPAYALLADQGIEADGEIVLRRVLTREGRSRAFANDAPIGATLLRKLGATLVEVQGQHDQMGLADAATHTGLLDGFGVDPALRGAVARAHGNWRAAERALTSARAEIAAAQREEDFLRHAAAELASLAPEPGEEEALARERQRLQQGEKRNETIASALAELSPQSSGRNRSAGPGAALRSAARTLSRLTTPDPAEATAIAALERAEEALAEAETLLSRIADAADSDPRLLERTEERLFSLRAMGRKYDVPVGELATLHRSLTERLAALETGEGRVAALAAETEQARRTFTEACAGLTAARTKAADALDRAVAVELPPLRLDRARFVTELMPLESAQWGAEGAEAARFLIATNPGQEPGPLGKVASGGELSRLMLALEVVLAGGSEVSTLVFDEVDSGVGGATAAAVGERLARVAEDVQVLLVTHSPQVAARGASHLRVSKIAHGGRAETRIEALFGITRREEIARMLAGETVTEAARRAADDLLSA